MVGFVCLFVLEAEVILFKWGGEEIGESCSEEINLLFKNIQTEYKNMIPTYMLGNWW